MSEPERGLTLPELPQDTSITPPILAATFHQAAAVLERESHVANAGSAFLAGGLMYAGSFALSRAAARLQEEASLASEDRDWLADALSLLGQLGAKFHWKQSTFASYAEALELVVRDRDRSVESPPAPSLEAAASNEQQLRADHRPIAHRPEPLTATGAVLLSHNHVAMLHGLYDRPNGVAPSSQDLVIAAMPYVARLRPCGTSAYCPRDALHTLHPSWAERKRIGRRVEWTLTPRGRGVVEQTVPAHIRGLGAYHGLASVCRPPRQL